MKIWITGIAGFLGSHLADTLIAEGHTVGGNDSLICGNIANVPQETYYTTFDCCGAKEGQLDFDFCWNPDQFGVPDVIVHAAATAHEGLSSFSPAFITRNIFEASVRTFSKAIEHGVKRIVYMSSMSRYGEGYNPDTGRMYGAPFDELYDVQPVDPYGVAKVAAEDVLKILCETHGAKYSILVPHNIIGMRQKYDDAMRNVASIMINRCLQGKPPIVYGDGAQKRCFSPVADCLPSIVKAVHGEADGEVVNIGPDGGEITIWDLANRIISLTDFEGVPIQMPSRPNEVKNAYCSSDKARRLLGYEPKQSLDDCLAEMVEDIKRRGVKPFVYQPIEIKVGCPKVWLERLM